MKPFLTLDEHLIDPILPRASREGYYLREASRGVVRDGMGAIALLHVTRDHYYKLPGGGIEKDEDPLKALERELLEEIGCHAIVTSELGTVLEQRYYQDMTQISHCFTADVVGEKGEPDYTEKEREAGFEIVWAKDLHEAIQLLESSEGVVSEEAINITFMLTRDVAIARRALSLAK